jgi:hypothetical protein
MQICVTRVSLLIGVGFVRLAPYRADERHSEGDHPDAEHASGIHQEMMPFHANGPVLHDAKPAQVAS